MNLMALIGFLANVLISIIMIIGGIQLSIISNIFEDKSEFIGVIMSIFGAVILYFTVCNAPFSIVFN